MPDSPPLVLDPRTRKRGVRAPDIDDSGSNRKASTDILVTGARLLDSPPRDVARLLERHGASLPSYLDAQRWRDIGAAQQRWPLIGCLAPKTSGEAP